jgi:hypothetical protein
MKETAVCPTDTVTLSISASTARVALPGKLVRVLTSADCFLKFGDSTVVAAVTDMPFKATSAGEYFSTETTRYTHVAAITASGSGTLTLTACQ